jgi:hypothetical protein
MGPRHLSYIGLLACLLTASAAAQTAALPDAPVPNPPAAQPDTRQQLQLTPKEREAERIKHLAIVNYRPYEPPTARDQFINYLIDSYGLPAFGRSLVRAAYAQGRGKPSEWGQDFPGFMQRYGSALASNAISGNVRYGMETVFHEDMRYIPCHGCRWKHKVENALLAEVTARHDQDGHRFFTLTPIVSDLSGPIIANSVWVPGGEPVDGLIAARTVFPVRIGAHLFQEFVLERRHHDTPED